MNASIPHLRVLDNATELDAGELIDSLPGMVYARTLGPGWPLTYLSAGTFPLTGYRPEDLLHSPTNNLRDLIHEEDIPTLEQTVEQAIATRKSYIVEYRIVAKNGEVHWVWDKGRGLYSPSGEPVGLQGFVSDITDRKGAIERLAEEKNLLRALIDNWPDIVYAQNGAGVFTLSNFAFARRLGKQHPSEVEGHPIDEFDLADDLRDSVAEDRRILAGEPPVMNREVAVPDEERGHTKSSLVSKIPIAGAHGHPVGVICVARDISERRRLQAQLNHSQKMEAIGRLAGGVAHDFNNILTAILGYSDLIANAPSLPDTVRRHVKEIGAGAARAAALTQQLLAFSRKQNLDPKIIGLNDIILTLESMLRRLIGENISLRTRLDSGLATVKADVGQIEQVIVNMVVNSRDAMPGGGCLTIETRNIRLEETFTARYSDLAPGSYVRVSITDDGIGIPREVQDRVFEPFFTTKGQGKGTGLGLATSYGIVKQNGGHITLYSEPGSGTTFNIYLPAAEGEAGENPLDAEDNKEIGGAEKILVVEDDEAVRTLTLSLLESFGYEVLVAVDGREALDLMRKSGPDIIDLVLTDVVMPHLGGKQLAEHLALCSPRTKILFTSGYNEEAIHHQGLLEGTQAFLQKPYSSLTLSHAVRNLLDAKR